MYDRLNTAQKMMDEKGSFLCHIDENEYERLYKLFEMYNQDYLSTVIWDKRNPMMGVKGIAIQHEYIIWSSNYKGQFLGKNENIKKILNKAKSIIKKNGGVNQEARDQFSKWIKKTDGLSGGERAYQYIEDSGRVYRHVAMTWPNPNPPPEQFFIPLIHPTTKKPCPVPSRGWSRTPEKMKELLDREEIVFGVDETTQPQRKIYLTLESKKPISSIIYNGRKGRNELNKLGLDFSYAHPVSLYEELIYGSLLDNEGYVLDFFAGSGTTGHATINLNREDEGKRKYILVEMGLYFETALKTRILKAIYSEDWRNGKPVLRNGSSHAFKYIKLESYEDTLNNLKLKRTEEQDQALLGTEAFREDYLLRYMLDFESKGSLLDLQVFDNPFDYQLKIASSTVGETVPTKVDLVETFNYLIGLQVRTIRKVDNVVLVEGRTRDNKNVLVIWRNTNKLDNEGLNAFFTKHFAERQKGFDTIYVNGDNTLANIRPQGATWKVHLTEEEFHYRMFEEQEA